MKAVFAVESITKKDPCNSLAAGAGTSFSANSSTSYKGIASKAHLDCRHICEFEEKPADGVGKSLVHDLYNLSVGYQVTLIINIL